MQTVDALLTPGQAARFDVIEAAVDEQHELLVAMSARVTAMIRNLEQLVEERRNAAVLP